MDQKYRAPGLRQPTIQARHRIPLENLVTACLACNLAKATRTPEEWRAELRQEKRGK